MMRTWLWVMLVAGAAWGQAPAWTVPEVRTELQKRYKVAETGYSPTGLKLSELVRVERASFPQATVTSGFYDLRGLSRYRSRPGLHLGYDVAMPAGATVLAAWPGKVLAITPWYGTEYGVTVSLPDGKEVTYGHIAPRVTIGQELAPGQPVGTIQVDHVDVKMRDSAGAPFDFGDGPNPAPVVAAKPLSKDELLASWVVYRGQWQTSLDELKTASRNLADPQYRKAQLQQKIRQLEQKNQQMPEFLAQGLVAQKDVQVVNNELKSARKEYRLLSSRAGEAPARVKTLDRARDAAARRLLQIRKQAAKRGLTWADAVALTERIVASKPALQKAVASSPARPGDDGDRELAASVKDGKTKLARLEELYAQGGIAKTELDAARSEQHMLEAEQQVLRNLIK